MSLHVWVGPMFAEKTSQLNKNIGAHLTIIPGLIGEIISPKIDTRSLDSKNPQTSHNPTYYGPPNNIRKMVVLEKLKDYNYDDVDVIGVEEAHFFPDLYSTVVEWLSKGKHIYVAGLDSNYKMEEFKNEDDKEPRFSRLSQLVHISDSFEKLTGVCIFCLNEINGVIHPSNIPRAPFTARLVSNDSEDLIGGSDIYRCVCRKHHPYNIKL